MSPGNDHWLAQHLMRAFVGPNGHLYQLDKLTGRVRRCRIAETECAPGYDPAAITEEIQRIENDGIRVIRDLFQQPIGQLDEDRMDSVVGYVALAYLRTPKAHRKVMELCGAGNEYHPLEEFSAVAEILKRRGWATIDSEQRTRFLLGDNPFQVIPRFPQQTPDTSIRRADNDVFLPVSPSRAVVGSFDLDAVANLTRRQINGTINYAQIKFADQHVYAGDRATLVRIFEVFQASERHAEV
jgi:hypothetical protein